MRQNGILMEVELVDTWRIGKKPKDYNVASMAGMLKILRQWSAISEATFGFIWSTGNEVPDQHNFYIQRHLIQLSNLRIIHVLLLQAVMMRTQEPTDFRNT